MRIAIFGDIHANLEAFEVVLADAREQGCTSYICLGDVVGYNANPRECLEITGGDLRWHEHDGARRGFCGVCGSRLFWDRERPTISIAAGSVDEPTGLTTGRHIYLESAGDWEDAG